MLHRQRGITLIGALFAGIAIVVVIVLGMRIAPSFSEYFTAKRMLKKLADESAPSAEALKRSFELQSGIGDITSFKAQDLIITKDNGRFNISVEWESRVHVVGNASLVFEFSIDTSGSPQAAAQ